ncbi:hypothetical protein J2S74_002460 [Evansella vedderi]|uniref:Uncharacterized protein n=1 Tax=Evansella vedderi TaxID=38282 RepID=A0ABT9ZV09_9BACI|nr:hypothetical protein [Evansella vedderi]MDQ0255078.1 hypothetical protein [Evansella vedderi]
MEHAQVLSLGIVILLMVWFELSQLQKHEKKEKVVFLGITVFTYGLAIFLIYNPDIYGPTQLISDIFSPLAPLLK